MFSDFGEVVLVKITTDIFSGQLRDLGLIQMNEFGIILIHNSACFNKKNT
jgi:hypothetical protein